MNGVPFLFINVTALCCFTLLFVTFLAAKKTPEIRSFILLLAGGIAWVGGAVFMRLQLWPGLKFWYYVSLIALFALEWLFYLFFLRFVHKKEPFTLVIWTIVDLAVLILTGTGFILPPPVPTKTAEGTVFLYTTMNWHVVIPVAFFIIFTLYIVYDIFRVVHQQGIHSPGLLLVIIGACIITAGNILQIAIPGNIFPYDALCGIFFAALLLIALYKKRMFRMTLIVSRSILLLVLGAICVSGAVYLIEPMEKFLTAKLRLSIETSTVLLAIAFSGILFLVYGLAKRMMDAVFTRDGQQNRLLKQFTADATRTLSTSEIMQKLSDAILGEIPVERVYICLPEGERFKVRYCSSPLENQSFYIPADSPQITWLRENAPYLITSEFRSSPLYLSVWNDEKALFRSLNIECMAAMKDGEEITGLILLSAKERGKKFNCSETEYLETISAVAAIAMKNAGLYEKMFREARIDALTGVYNYRYFAEQEVRLFQQCQKDCISLLLVDVDDFKLYNQLYGVRSGDDALRRISEEISRCAMEIGTVFRTSGKVFAVLLPHEDAHRAMLLAEEIQRRVRAINQTAERKQMKTLSVSIGICAAPYAASTAKELLDNADLATYNAKQSGKDRILVFRGISAVVPQQLSDRTDAIVGTGFEQTEEQHGAAAMISALTAAIDAKDHYTYAHSKNVARYAANLAVAAGLNDDQVRTIYSAGLLHDIGKISIPEDILNKTGKLTDQEYTVMKNHVNGSIEMIRHLPEMDYLIPAVLGHHERWDGSGYPRGIRGEDIPVTARCLTVSDCFDAMTTDRPYRHGLPLEYALQQIEQGEGKQFDPHLAAIFVQLVRGENISLSAQIHRT